MSTNKLTIQKGNPYTAVLTFTDSAGVAYDLTGKTVFFTVKNKEDEEDDDSDALITKNITVHTNAAGGITTLELTALQTDITVGDYEYDLRVYDDSPLVQMNSLSGVCEVRDVVTKRIA
jgi:hypothetical protein